MRRLILLAAILTAAACGGSNDATTQPPGPPPNAVTIQALPSLAFQPATATVAAGGMVTFSFGPITHNVTWDANANAPANIPNSTSTDVQLNAPPVGTYTYHCTIHPGMHGTLVVK
jgi:plastocyanin